MDLAISILVLGGFALLIGALALWRKGVRGRRPVLMLIAALVLWLNAAIWLWPTAQGESLATAVRTGGASR